MPDAGMLAIARDAERLFAEVVRELPDDGAIVRQIAALFARHTAVAAWFSARASLLGLATAKGRRALDESLRHGQRAERCAVTLIDLAGRLATSKRTGRGHDHLAELRRRLAAVPIPSPQNEPVDDDEDAGVSDEQDAAAGQAAATTGGVS